MDDFIYPNEKGFTIYSKSGCINCNKAKELLKKNNLDYKVIDCDEYLLEVKEEFLYMINNLINREYKTFPMIFYDNKFIGGFSELQHLINFELLNFSYFT